ncbi:Protein CBG00509 [Caenorhabditis briggsae]|uniref:Protein CBG00509 n=1 Tax=Caenorhabditis briggsae TaxID=6238 RepID=A8WNR0_CAEBR|nr:Protein CBG00509 [Caenorhabditis briggsae]CAP22115.1 Protein CBG00509 [Caenorhabditis briggsae]
MQNLKFLDCSMTCVEDHELRRFVDHHPKLKTVVAICYLKYRKKFKTNNFHSCKRPGRAGTGWPGLAGVRFGNYDKGEDHAPAQVIRAASITGEILFAERRHGYIGTCLPQAIYRPIAKAPPQTTNIPPIASKSPTIGLSREQ